MPGANRDAGTIQGRADVLGSQAVVTKESTLAFSLAVPIKRRAGAFKRA